MYFNEVEVMHMAREHHRDLLEQAERMRNAASAVRGRKRRKSFLGLAVGLLGSQLVSIGRKMQELA